MCIRDRCVCVCVCVCVCISKQWHTLQYDEGEHFTEERGNTSGDRPIFQKKMTDFDIVLLPK